MHTWAAVIQRWWHSWRLKEIWEKSTKDPLVSLNNLSKIIPLLVSVTLHNPSGFTGQISETFRTIFEIVSQCLYLIGIHCTMTVSSSSVLSSTTFTYMKSWASMSVRVPSQYKDQATGMVVPHKQGTSLLRCFAFLVYVLLHRKLFCIIEQFSTASLSICFHYQLV